MGTCTRRRCFFSSVFRNFISSSVRRGPLDHTTPQMCTRSGQSSCHAKATGVTYGHNAFTRIPSLWTGRCRPHTTRGSGACWSGCRTSHVNRCRHLPSVDHSQLARHGENGALAGRVCQLQEQGHGHAHQLAGTARHSTRWQHHHMCQSHRRTCGVAAPSWATKEAVLMMDPPPAAFIAGMACLQP